MPFYSSVVDGEITFCSKKVIVFGNGGHTRTVYGYFFDEHRPHGFVVDDAFVDTQSDIGGIPVSPLSMIAEKFPPSEYAVLVALGFRNMNQLRKDKSEELKSLGYEFVSFIDRSVRLPEAYSIEPNSIIIGNVDVHDGVVIKQGVFVSSGAVLGHDSVLEEFSWVGSGAVLTGCINVGECSVIGMNASVKQNTVLGHHSLIAPNVFVNADTKPYASIVSAPCKVVPVDSRKLHRFSYR